MLIEKYVLDTLGLEYFSFLMAQVFLRITKVPLINGICTTGGTVKC